MVSAIVLAAGESKRTGEINKLLLEFDGYTLIEKIVKTLEDSMLKEIIIVTGHESDKIKIILSNHSKLKFVHNKIFRKGMTTSIQEGVRYSSSTAKGYMICLADMPLLTSLDVNNIITYFSEAHEKNYKNITVPLYNNKRGNPVIFSSYYKNEILNHKETNGCKAIVKKNDNFVTKVQVENSHFIVDIDTIDQYKTFQRDNLP